MQTPDRSRCAQPKSTANLASTRTLCPQPHCCNSRKGDRGVGVCKLDPCYPSTPMAGELGFEPRLTESESAVLPLNYSPMRFYFKGLAREPGCFVDIPPCHAGAHVEHPRQLSKWVWRLWGQRADRLFLLLGCGAKPFLFRSPCCAATRQPEWRARRSPGSSRHPASHDFSSACFPPRSACPKISIPVGRR